MNKQEEKLLQLLRQLPENPPKLTPEFAEALAGLNRPFAMPFWWSPEMSDYYSNRALPNRLKNSGNRGRILEDVQNDEYYLTQQPIIISSDNRRMDGETRADAFKLSGREVITSVAFGTDPSAMPGIDGQVSRTAGDALAAAYPETKTKSKFTAHAIGYLHMYGRGVVFASNNFPTRRQIVKAYGNDPFLQQAMNDTPVGSKIKVSPKETKTRLIHPFRELSMRYLGLVANRYEITCSLINQVQTGLGLEASTTAFTLNRYLNENKGKNNPLNKRQRYLPDSITKACLFCLDQHLRDIQTLDVEFYEVPNVYGAESPKVSARLNGRIE